MAKDKDKKPIFTFGEAMQLLERGVSGFQFQNAQGLKVSVGVDQTGGQLIVTEVEKD